jgi:hypothetical protein
MRSLMGRLSGVWWLVNGEVELQNPGVTVQADPPADPPHLERRLSLFPATALNRANMLGAGPFITIPLLMSALSGPQSLLVFATTPVRTIAMALGALGLG